MFKVYYKNQYQPILAVIAKLLGAIFTLVLVMCINLMMAPKQPVEWHKDAVQYDYVIPAAEEGDINLSEVEYYKAIGEYQLQVENDAIIIYDDKRYVGTIPYHKNDCLHKMIMNDNR